MFTSILHRLHSPHANEPDDATTFTATSIKSDDTPKSILRRQGSERNTLRNVSWSATYETLEHDSFEQCEGMGGADSTWTYEDTATYDTRTYGTNTYDSTDSRSTFETRETSFETRDADTFETRETSQMMCTAGTASTNDSLESVEAYESGIVTSGSDMADHDTATTNCEEGEEQTLTQMKATGEDALKQEHEPEPVVDNNENLELRNIACAASNVTEASELADKYGLSEREAKKGMRLLAADSCVSDIESVFGDKYHGLEDEPTGEEKPYPTPTEAQALDKIEGDLATSVPGADAPLNVEVSAPVEGGQNPLSPISVDAVNVFIPGEAEPIEDRLIQEIPSVDSLTVGSLSEEQLSQSFEDQADAVSLKANSDEGSLASLKKKGHGYEGLFQEQNTVDKSLGHIGLILPFLSRLQCGAFIEDTAVLDAVDSREWAQNASIKEEIEDEEEAFGGTVTENGDEQDTVDQSEEDRQLDTEDVVEYQIGEDGKVKVRVNGEVTSIQSEEDNTHSRDSNAPSEQKCQMSEESDDDEFPRIGGIISFAAEDDSIPSNQSEGQTKGTQQKDRRGFKSFATLRKRVSSIASSIVGKNKSKTQSIKKQSKPTAIPHGTLHDRVYHDNVPASETRISTELILDDLKIVENTAKIMFQDRFNNTPSLLNPGDEGTSMPISKGQEIGSDGSSQKSKSTVESALSPMFRDYFSS